MVSIWDHVQRTLSASERKEYDRLADKLDNLPYNVEFTPFLDVPESLKLPLLVYQIRTDLELRAQKGERRVVEYYLDRYPELKQNQVALLEILLADYKINRAKGMQLNDVIWRYPHLKEELRAAAAELELLPWELPPGYSYCKDAKTGEIESHPLGKGGWGVVYKVVQQDTGRIEALKVADPKYLSSSRNIKTQQYQQNLREEIPKAAKISHPHIVQVYFVGEYNGYPYFTMEFCENGDLHNKLHKQPESTQPESTQPERAQPMGVRESAKLVRTLADAMGAVHQLHIVHRDLKPSNILFDKDNNPKIADFGLAIPSEIAAKSRSHGTGTPLYMAPEQHDTEFGPVTRETDVYALGLILYECLTGKVPFETRDRQELSRAACEDPPTPPQKIRPEIPQDLQAICLKCLQKKPKDRYETGAKLAEDLNRFLHGDLVKARSHGVVRRASHWVWKHPIPVLISIAIVGSTLAGLKIMYDANTLANQQNLARLDKIRTELENRQTLDYQAKRSAARDLTKRGDWVNALLLYDQLIAANRDDALRLRVERLTGYFAVNRTAELESELEKLDRLPLGENAAQVKLLHGAWICCDWSQLPKGRALVQAAWNEKELLFSDADRAFAEGLTAKTLGQALQAYQRASEADPFHYLGNSSHLVALLTTGQEDELKRKAAFLRSVFPYSPVADFGEAAFAFLENNKEVMDHHLTAAQKLFPPDRQAAIGELRGFLHELLTLNEKVIALDSNNKDPLALGFAMQLPKVIGQIPRLQTPLGLPIPSLGLVINRLLGYMGINAALTVEALLPNEFKVQQLEAFNRDFEDSVALLYLAAIRYRQSTNLFIRKDVQGALSCLRASLEYSERASRATSLVKQSMPNWNGKLLVMEMMSRLLILRLDPELDIRHTQRLYELLPKIVKVEHQNREFRRRNIEISVEAIFTPINANLLSKWNLDRKENVARYRLRVEELATFGNALLSCWATDTRDEADTKSIAELRAKLQHWYTEEEKKWKNAP